MALWIDTNWDGISVGDLVFVAQSFNTSNGTSRYVYSNRPFSTNQSHQPRLYGWCGETNSRSVTAKGLYRVTRVATKSERVQVVKLTGHELAAGLDRVGHPDLVPA